MYQGTCITGYKMITWKKKKNSLVGEPRLLPIPVTFSPSPIKGHKIYKSILSAFLMQEKCVPYCTLLNAETQRKKSMFKLA